MTKIHAIAARADVLVLSVHGDHAFMDLFASEFPAFVCFATPHPDFHTGGVIVMMRRSFTSKGTLHSEVIEPGRILMLRLVVDDCLPLHIFGIHLDCSHNVVYGVEFLNA